jgi:hypothetical protein
MAKLHVALPRGIEPLFSLERRGDKKGGAEETRNGANSRKISKAASSGHQ